MRLGSILTISEVSPFCRCQESANRFDRVLGLQCILLFMSALM